MLLITQGQEVYHFKLNDMVNIQDDAQINIDRILLNILKLLQYPEVFNQIELGEPIDSC